MLAQRHLTFDTIGLAFVHAVHASTASSTPPLSLIFFLTRRRE
jgi:hypothetical protein